MPNIEWRINTEANTEGINLNIEWLIDTQLKTDTVLSENSYLSYEYKVNTGNDIISLQEFYSRHC